MEGFQVNWKDYIDMWEFGVLGFFFFSIYGVKWVSGGSMLASTVHVIFTLLAYILLPWIA